MKKILLSAVSLLLLVSCSNDETSSSTNLATTISGHEHHRGCASHEVLEQQLRENPELAAKMQEIERFTQNAITNGRLVNGKIEIPVVVNVLYKTTAENISLTQIQSQIDVLNKDFNALNSDFNQVPSVFSGVKANVGISFVLDAVYRKSTTKKSWGTNDAMKKINSRRNESYFTNY